MPKNGIHPTYFPQASVVCSCGATYAIGSTRENLKVEICRQCHPYYSGNQKFIDTAGRVDRFREKMATAKSRQDAKTAKKPKKSEKTETHTPTTSEGTE
jgi:large subunit ribosomal protein L31